MFKHTFTSKAKVAFFAALVGLASCQPERIETPQQDQLLLETSSSQPIKGQYIVVLKQEAVNGRYSKRGNYNQRTSAMLSAISPILRKARINEEAIDKVYSSTILGFSAKLDNEMLERLRKDPDVSYIEQDMIVTFAPPWERGDEDSGAAQETPTGITRVGGAVVYSGDNVAWVVDTGIDLDHPDLNVDHTRGFNAFTTGRDSKSLDDGNGHGTHVAGTIAAIDNSVGVVGVAAGATVIPVKVLDSRGSGSYSGVIQGVDHVAANGSSGDVANLSLGGPVSQALDDAIVEAAGLGIIFCLAAGNDSDDSNNYSPARANGANIYTISAMDGTNDQWASFSNFGNPPIDYCAPGVNIKSTWKDGSYNTISGTSMATPHAAGVFILTGGSSLQDAGTVQNDPDGNSDPIIAH